MYWGREVAGWVLVAIGLILFAVVHDYCERRWMFEAFILAGIGIFVFRGGIHLLKVSIAARICQEAQDRMYPAPPPARGEAAGGRGPGITSSAGRSGIR